MTKKGKVFSNSLLLFSLSAILVLVLIGVIFSILAQSNQVVVYVSHDQDYSEPILLDFQKETGIKIKAVYDTESTKTTGLVNRLIEEKNNPQADVFWNNEVSRTLVLKNKDILEPYCSINAEGIDKKYKDKECYWTGFAARARILLINTDLVSLKDAPKTLEELTDKKWQNKITLANPLFGTTASHMSALFVVLGKEKAETFFKKLKENGLIISESNGRTRDAVASGTIEIGFTDTDDANDAVVDGKAVSVIYPDQGKDQIGTLIIPNSVMLIKGGKNKENAKILIDYLLSPETERKLAFSKAAQMPLHIGVKKPKNVPDVSKIKTMNVTWQEVTEMLPLSQEFLMNLFIS